MTEGEAAARLTDAGATAHQYRAVFQAIDEGVSIIERMPGEPGALRDYRILAMNPAVLTLFGLPDLSGKKIRSNFSDEIDSWFDHYDRVLTTDQPERFERQIRWRNLTLETSIVPLDCGPGDVLMVVTRDVTERVKAQREAEEAREHQQMLTRELSHRLKNLLTLILSIAAETLRGADSLADASAKLSARIMALSHAADGLADASSAQEGRLKDVVRTGLASAGGFTHRIDISGPDLAVGSRAALSLTLAIHELATNAIKYGALSNEAGRVSLSWKVCEAEAGPDARFVLEWRESGGPAVSAPGRRGFGTRMIERAQRALFSGEVCLAFPPEGTVFRIDTPLAELGAAN